MLITKKIIITKCIERSLIFPGLKTKTTIEGMLGYLGQFKLDSRVDKTIIFMFLFLGVNTGLWAPRSILVLRAELSVLCFHAAGVVWLPGSHQLEGLVTSEGHPPSEPGSSLQFHILLDWGGLGRFSGLAPVGGHYGRIFNFPLAMPLKSLNSMEEEFTSFLRSGGCL